MKILPVSVNAWTLNPIRRRENNSGGSMIEEVTLTLKNLMEDVLRGKVSPKSVHTRGDASISEFTESFGQSLVLSTKGSAFPVGLLYLKEEPRRVFMAWVSSAHSGKKFGEFLYETALDINGILYSSDDLSVGSSILWKQLLDKHGGRYAIPDALSPTGKETEVDIVAWETVGKTYWPVFVMPNGEKRSLRKLIRGKGSSVDAAKYGYYIIRK